jgi:hypothetical protein
MELELVEGKTFCCRLTYVMTNTSPIAPFRSTVTNKLAFGSTNINIDAKEAYT